MALRRICKELNEPELNSASYIQVSPRSEHDFFNWKATIAGPKESPYADGTFEINVHFPVDYPFKPPRLHFVTKVFHPNIDLSGGICLAILRAQWSPALALYKVLEIVQNLLEDPQPGEGTPAAMTLCKQDRAQFNATARPWTKRYAM